MERNDGNKVLLQLDWDRLLPTRDDGPPPALIIEPSSDSLSQPSKLTATGLNQQSPVADNIERLSDSKLIELLQGKKRTLETTGPKLPDKGEKLRALVKQYEDELARRERILEDNLEQLSDGKLVEFVQEEKRTLETTGPKLPDKGEKLRALIKQLGRRKGRFLDKEVDANEKPRPATRSSIVGWSIGFRQENESSKARPPSSFVSSFNNKMKDTDCQKINAFNNELSHFKHSHNHKMRHNEDFSQKKRKRDQPSSRQSPFQCPSNISRSETPSDDESPRAASTFSLQRIGEKLSARFTKLKDAFKAIRSDGSRSRKDQLIILDEEDDDLYNLDGIDGDDKLVERLKETRIYYPSSDDPESVEICYTDMDCLGSRGYLTSPIMNFYMRYLQQQASLTDRSVTDYLFLNTYFYKKLKDAGSYKQSDRETFYVKFRRWWKGVNIFQKAYILIPIHEDLHWSLAIICMPYKEDESGPVILHLDSLSLHSSRSIFDNIRRYLIEEWRYLDQGSMCSDISIADGIWKNLDCKIKERIITVPQQKNDYDCGLFVLYFIKRFIEVAPERLKKEDMAMFGRQWFQPEEASDLRVRIRALLKIEFYKSHKQNNISRDSVVTIHDS